MDFEWLFERFGAAGLMLFAMVYDRSRLLKQLEAAQSRIDVLTDRLVSQSQESVYKRIDQEAAYIEAMERMVKALAVSKGSK
ncbi:hypothetical protein [uncultured Sulfitobacter sp.]|uniref:hypothetical protein n=1 Tax=uncultured Sulfitobacter sp. TaxID=191468 RepID=UPI002602F15D|nr:hypothetical protein [uncultured Sulfitobacter sp.]